MKRPIREIEALKSSKNTKFSLEMKLDRGMICFYKNPMSFRDLLKGGYTYIVGSLIIRHHAGNRVTVNETFNYCILIPRLLPPSLYS